MGETRADTMTPDQALSIWKTQYEAGAGRARLFVAGEIAVIAGWYVLFKDQAYVLSSFLILWVSVILGIWWALITYDATNTRTFWEEFENRTGLPRRQHSPRGNTVFQALGVCVLVLNVALAAYSGVKATCG